MTNGRIVLIVEEEPVVHKSIATQLKKSQFQVLTAHNEEEAFERILDDFVDVVITDEKMLDESNELFSNIKSLPKADRPIVYVVSESAQEREAEKKNWGVHKFMEKPIDVEKICQDIKSSLKNMAA